MRPGWLLILLAFALCVNERAAAQEPYDLRGIQLGMTLEALRALPYPDPGEYPVKLICGEDPEVQENFEDFQDVWPLSDDKASGIQLCRYYVFAHIWREEELDVATIGSEVIFQVVREAPDSSVFRLYSITVVTDIENWNTLYEGYLGKYGDPTQRSDEPIQNNTGATFDNTELVWDNGVSTLTLVKRFDRIDATYVFYEHTALSAQVKANRESVTGAPEDNL